jgi:Glycosyltransferase family 87
MLRSPRIALRAAGPALGLLLYRLLLLAALPYEALTAYGDLRHFHQLAQLPAAGGGLPFIGHWIEFPPLFPFLSVALNSLAGGSEHAYVYAIAALMACFDAANLYLLGRIIARLGPGEKGMPVVWCYFAFLALPAIGWWTFEPLGVFWLLLTVFLVLESRPAMAGVMAGLGLLTKWVPGLGLLAAWPHWSRRRIALAVSIAAALTLLVWVPLLVLSGNAAWDSLRSQSAKPAWETAWALLDGTLGTGTFGEAALRLAPLEPSASTPVVPRWLPFVLAGGLGAVLAVRTRPSSPRAGMALLLVGLVLLFLASPGWSPQWLAYIVPVVLLTLPHPKGVLYSAALTSLAVLEWPVLLSRGRFDLLWVTILVRTLVMAVLAVDAWTCARHEPAVRGAGGLS